MATSDMQRWTVSWRRALCAAGLMLGASCAEPGTAAPATDWPPTLTGTDELHPELVLELEARVRAIVGAPDDALAAARLGLLCEANDLWSAARDAFERATALDPTEPAWPFHAALARLPLDDHAGALAWLETHVVHHPNHAPLAALFAEELMLVGEIEKAELQWRAALRTAPAASEVLAGLGEALLNGANTMQAVGYLRQSVGLDPGNKRAHYLLGTALARLGHDEEAAAELSRGAGARPQRLLDDWWRKARGLSYRPSDQLNQAEEFASNGRLDEALAVLDRAAELWPTNAPIACAHGITLARLGRKAAAVDVLGPLGEGRRELEEASVEYARALHSLGRLEDAVVAFREARAWRPRKVVVRFELGRALVELERFEEARTIFEELARERPEDGRPQLDLAELELCRGDLDLAARALGSARKIGAPPARIERLTERLEELRSAPADANGVTQ